MTLRRGLLLGFGSVAGLIAVLLLGVGGVLLWADSKREEDGFFTTSTEQFQTTSYALVSKNLDLASDAPGWLFDSGQFGDVRLNGTSNDPAEEIFIGIVLGLGIGFLVAGIALLIGGITMIIFGARERPEGGRDPSR